MNEITYEYGNTNPIGKVTEVFENEYGGITMRIQLNEKNQKIWEDIFEIKKENKMKKLFWKLFKKNKPCYKSCKGCKWAKYCKNELI